MSTKDVGQVTWVGRNKECNQLRNLLRSSCKNDQNYKGNSDSVYIFGGPATGKTGIVREICKVNKLRHAYIPCLEITTARAMYENILNQLASHEPNASNDYKIFGKCDRGISSFFEHLDKLPYDDTVSSTIVIDGLEHLNKNQAAIGAIAGMMCNQKRRCIVLVVISRSFPGLDALSKVFSGRHTHLVHFRNYTPKEVKAILTAPHLLPKKLKMKSNEYKALMDYLVDNIHTSITNIITYLRLKNAIDFAIVKEKLKFQKCKNLILRLSSNIIKDDLRSGEVREYTESEKYLSDMDRPWNIDQEFDLSPTAQYIALAAYLCAYNHPKLDMKYFGVEKVLGKRKKRSIDRRKLLKDALPQKLKGSQVFPLERLISVFHRIWDQNPPTLARQCKSQTNVLSSTLPSEVKKPEQWKSGRLSSAVSTLTTLGILAQTSKDPMDEVKMKCLLGHRYAEEMARSIGFPLKGYLHNQAPV